MKFARLAILFFALLAGVSFAAPTGEDDALRARIVNFAESSLPGTTQWSAAVLKITPLAFAKDPYVVFKDLVVDAFAPHEIFAIGGSDTHKTVHLVVVSVNDTAIDNPLARISSQGIPSDLFDPESLDLEFVTTGLYDATAPTPQARGCITLGRPCACKNKCKCTGYSTTRVCNCKRWLYFTCDCPRNPYSCGCGSGSFGANYCRPTSG